MSAREFFEEQHGLTPQRLERILAEALANGGDYADVYAEHRLFTSLHLEENVLKEISEAVSQGVGVRVVAGEETGYAYTNDLSLSGLLGAARTAGSVARFGPRVTQVNLSPIEVPNRFPAARPPYLGPIEDIIASIEAANESARAADPRVREVTVHWGDEWRQVVIATSEGQLAHDTTPLFVFSVSVVVEEEGNRQVGWKNLGLRAGLEIFSPDKAATLAREAVAQATTLLRAQPAPAGEMPIVLAPGTSGVLLHESVGHPLEADANRKKLSVFSGRVGEKVASELCTVIDDATQPHLRGSINMDGEGFVPTQPTVLIEKGVLRGYLQDKLSARLMKMAPTGNGRRQDYSAVPIPRMTNTFLAAGEDNPFDILRSVPRGIYCRAFSGGQVEPAVGQFTFSMHEAYLIENGNITTPVKGATLIGSGQEVLQNIVAVGHDLLLDRGAWACGKQGQSAPVGVGTPTVKIARMTVGGMR
ncbi:MAG TPA: metallopeptidase TldD-related protein [Candidatus Xenobia bacterium]|nr:metallopeptidase TldD-related protein [Candidatus Xenobia bacterium]